MDLSYNFQPLHLIRNVLHLICNVVVVRIDDFQLLQLKNQVFCRLVRVLLFYLFFHAKTVESMILVADDAHPLIRS